MNSLTHLVEDMDEAFSGDFDGSLCFMSLSIDFTSSQAGPHLGLSRDVSTSAAIANQTNTNNQNNNQNNQNNNNAAGMFDLAAAGNQSRNKPINYGLNHDVHNDNSNNCFNYFKRFKSAITSAEGQTAFTDEESMTESQNKIVRQLQQIKNCFNTTAITNTTTTITANSNNITAAATTTTNNNNNQTLATLSSAQPALPAAGSGRGSSSPTRSDTSGGGAARASALSTPDEFSSASSSSTTNARSPSPNSSKQKFQYVLAEPISVATKLTEDTMTYLNQGQAYEIKLENITDVAEVKKGFMCSIIRIGFHERHMQQAEDELWQSWSQQNPNNKIFSVDMKLSYNIFGLEWDGLNRYEFLWDSSKTAGLFIRINSISTEFTPKKHGGQKGAPLRISIESFSYQPKTHNSFFISAAYCQVKVFKPKGAERKIKSDRDKILKRPLSEQEKYCIYKSCEHTFFKECSLATLHPMEGDSLSCYRHSHGQFAQKQAHSTSNNISSTPQNHHQPEAEEEGQTKHRNANNDREYQHSSRLLTTSLAAGKSDYSASRLIQQQHSYGKKANNYDQQQESDHHNIDSNNQTNYANNPQQQQQASAASDHPAAISHNPSAELLPFQQPPPPPPPPPPAIPNLVNQMYYNQVRGVGLAYTIPASKAPAHFQATGQTTTTTTYAVPTPTPLSTAHGASGGHNFHHQSSHHNHHHQTNPPIYRNFNYEKSTTPQSTSFKASNLAISFCPEQAPDNPANHYPEHYDFHPHHSIHNQQQSFQRQRSASMSNGQCTTYGSGSYVRHVDINYNSGMIETNNNSNNNHWPVNIHHQTNNSSQTPRPNSVEVNQNSDADYNNYDCNDTNYHSQKSCENQTETETSSSCSGNKNDNDFETSSSNITVNSSCAEFAAYLHENCFDSQVIKIFDNFSGYDVLQLTKSELINLIGLRCGLRLFYRIHRNKQ